MNHNITKFFSRAALVAFLAVAFAGATFAQTTVSISSFSATSGSIDSNVSYEAFQGDGTSGPAIYSDCLRIYKPASGKSSGGYIRVSAASGYTISSVTITNSNDKAGTLKTSVNGGDLSSDVSFAKQATYTVNNVSASTVDFYNCGSDRLSIAGFSVTYASSGGSSLSTSDLAITDAPVSLSFDLYNNSSAQTVSYTTSSTGAITVSGGTGYVTTSVNAASKTVTVTPVAVTPSAQTITISQAADDSYKAGSATFTVSVGDSTPGVSFLAGTDLGTTTTNADGDVVSKDGITISSTKAAFATTEYRFYQDSETTISTSEGVITSVSFTGVSGYPASRFSNQSGWTTSDNDGVWTGSATSVSFTASQQVRASRIFVTVDLNAAPDPIISADDVNLAFNAMEGNIAFTITNPASDGVVSASTNDTWLTLGSQTTSPISFTCQANSETTARSATVTLTYTYNTSETVTKNVTVTQAASPVIYSTIPALFTAATSTETGVYVTFNDWVVSGVSTNGKNVFVTDNNGNGFVIFDNNGGLGSVYSAGAILSGTAVSCNLVLYNGFAEVKNISASDLTITPGGTVSAASIDMADLAGVNTGALVSYSNLTCSVTSGKYYLSDGTTTLQVYNTLYAFEALVAGKTYNITGVYQQYNSTKEILPRSAADIEEVVVTTPSITVDPATVNKSASEVEGTMDIIYANLPITDMSDFDVQYCDSEGVDAPKPSWVDDVLVAEKDPSEGEGYVVSFTIQTNDGAARSAYFKIYALDNDLNIVYSNLVTITQAAYVPDYATLTFSFDGGRADIESTAGLTHEGLDSDYKSSPKLKFNTTGDWLILKFNETPGVLTFDIKGNGANSDPWSGTFTVQASSDGVAYTEVASFTDNLGDTQTITINNLESSVRYIKWIYTTKTLGNVALGNIKLKRFAPASIVLTATLNNGRYWTTFYNSLARYTLSEGAQAFIMDSNKVLYRLGDDGSEIPANTAVVIIANTASITLTKSTSNDAVDTHSIVNILEGSDIAVAKPSGGKTYVLGVVDGAIGFYEYTASENIPATKAYYFVNN